MAETPEHVPRALCPLAPAAQMGGASAAGPRQHLPMDRKSLEGWGQKQWQAAIGEDGRPSGLEAETTGGVGEGAKR